MLHHQTHRKLYLFFLFVLALGLTMGKLLMSISMIGLSLNWLLEREFKIKWQRNKEKGYVPIIFVSLFLLEGIWIFVGEEVFFGIDSLRIKLPLLILPIVFGTSKRLNDKEFKKLVITFLSGVLLSTVIAVLVEQGWINKKSITGSSRDISIFMSHIRYSLVLCFAVLLLVHLIITKQINKLFGVLFSLWLGVLIYKMSSITAILGLIIGLGVYFIYIISTSNLRMKVVLGFVFLSFLSFLFVSIFNIINDHYSPKEKGLISELPHRSLGGEKYNHLQNKVLENGYYVWNNIAEKEVSKAWEKRSKINIKGKDNKGQNIKHTLYRYLTSMGLKKDKEGLSMLSFADIKEIENGKTSAIEYNKIEKRFREFLFEIDNYKTTKNPNNHSLTQRLLYWKIGVEIIKESPIIGVGSGAAKKAYKNYYKSNSTILSLNNQRNAHNQFITQFINLGLIGFLIWGLIILIPVIKLFKLKSPLMVAFFLSMLIALISDDMLERQAGVTICASIFYIFLFNEKDEKLKGLFLLKKNTK
jgi:hypothetical protein